MFACTGRECDAPVERPPVPRVLSHPHKEHCPSETPEHDREQITQIDKHIRNLQKDLGLYTRKLEAVESDLHKLEKADDVKVLSQRLEAVRALQHKQMQETVHRFEERLQSLEVASARAAERLPESATSGQPSEIAPMSALLAVEDRLSKLEKAEEHLALAVEAHDQELGGLSIERTSPRVDAAVHLQNAHLLNLQHEEQKQRYDAILEELAEIRMWHANLDQQEDATAKDQHLRDEESHHASDHKSHSAKHNVDNVLKQSPDSLQCDAEIPGSKVFSKNQVAEFDHVYEFQNSVYDTLMFMNLPCLNVFHSIVLVFGFLCNLLMVGVIVQILSTDAFTSSPFENTHSVTTWRRSDAHLYSYVDPVSHSTLAHRVCDLDPSLSVATYQKAILEDIDEYKTSGGALLANIAVVLWIFCCALEIRTTLDFVVVIWCIPRGRHTLIVEAGDGGIFFSTLSFSRTLLGSFAAVMRFTAASFLLAEGSLWLAYTGSITDLLLNASALGFVLELDNTIFSAISSYPVIGLLAALKPPILPKRKFLALVPSGIILGTIGLMIYINYDLVDYVSQQMTLTREAMCEPESSLQMVTGTSPLGWLTYMDLPTTANDVHVNQVHELIISQSSEAYLYAFPVSSFSEIVKYSTNDLASFVDATLTDVCEDDHLTALQGSGGRRLDDGPPTLGRKGQRLWAATGSGDIEKLDTCAEVRQYCHDTETIGSNVRFMCPLTCGCAIGRPAQAKVTTAGLPDMDMLWDLATSQYGCPQAGCSGWKELYLRGMSCLDRNLTFLLNNGWEVLLNRMRDSGYLQDSSVERLMQRGCEGISQINASVRDQICATAELTENYHGVATACPVSCKCKAADCRGTCPQQCCNNAVTPGTVNSSTGG